MRYFVLVFFIIGISSGQDVEAQLIDRCGPNMVYNTCGTACPKRCCNRNVQFFYTEQCVAGCFCIDGYVLNYDGICVPPEKCECGINEVYSICGLCDGTCENPFPICLAVCRPGCYCKPGYVRRNGICIPRSVCGLVLVAGDSN